MACKKCGGKMPVSSRHVECRTCRVILCRRCQRPYVPKRIGAYVCSKCIHFGRTSVNFIDHL